MLKQITSYIKISYFDKPQHCTLVDKSQIQNLPENSHLVAHVLSNFGTYYLPKTPFWSTNLAPGHLPLISIALWRINATDLAGNIPWLNENPQTNLKAW